VFKITHTHTHTDIPVHTHTHRERYTCVHTQHYHNHSIQLAGYDFQKDPKRVKRNESVCVCVCVCGCRGGFRHGRPGQPPGPALFHKTWGAARAFKKKLSAKRFSIIYHITVCGIGKLAPPAAAGASARYGGAV